MGATAHALGAANLGRRSALLTRKSNLPDAQLLRLPRAATRFDNGRPSRLGGSSRRALLPPLGTSAMGEGGGAGIHAVWRRFRTASRASAAASIHGTQPQPLLPGLRDLAGPAATRADVNVEDAL